MWLKRFCVSLPLVALLCAPSSRCNAATITLPDDEDLNKIVKLCAMGISSGEEAQGKMKAALHQWRGEVEAKGKIKKDEVGAILDHVKNERNFSVVAPQYYACVEKRLAEYVKKTEVSYPPETLEMSAKNGKTNNIIISSPQCSKEGIGNACYASVTSETVDTELCISETRSKVITNGINIASQFYIEGRGYYSPKKEANVELVQGVPVRIGMLIDGEIPKQIALLKIATCSGKSIMVKHFASDGNVSDSFYYVRK